MKIRRSGKAKYFVLAVLIVTCVAVAIPFLSRSTAKLEIAASLGKPSIVDAKAVEEYKANQAKEEAVVQTAAQTTTQQAANPTSQSAQPETSNEELCAAKLAEKDSWSRGGWQYAYNALPEDDMTYKQQPARFLTDGIQRINQEISDLGC